MKKYQKPIVKIINFEAEQTIAISQIDKPSGNVDQPSGNVPDMIWGN